jgi:hypothetical protein
MKYKKKTMEFHESIRESLKYSIDEIEKENMILKERVKEVENALLPRPSFFKLIASSRPLNILKDTPESKSRLKSP